jgi:hypothetical protein
MIDVRNEIAALKRMTVAELQERYAAVFGEPTKSHHKQYLWRRIAWRLQANAEGDLSDRARRRAAELANDGDLRLYAPRKDELPPAPRAARTATGRIETRHDPRVPMPGTILERPYKGRTIRVTVLRDGFEYAGETYKSLSAVAKAVTGSHWNGYHFFGIGKENA